ncbi:uncharacterized protein EKO05_0007122 [Ascochyta rabiei]|uniref:uncharacterized protein n=1 Tax=Didymella rabiei TaxID=5454 RepID=UPI0019022C62|nr:uncharacterized protein EKO05_0007122 [Ascochyta rabiei]UPX16735.1 hypothetical protein EKO05_0007122 [Ascochyta rabiei]
MAKFACALLVCAALLGGAVTQSTKQTYIVQLESQPDLRRSTIQRRSAHESSLQRVAPQNTIIYSYQHVFDGYAASLSDTQARALLDQPGVKAVTRSKKYHLHTTHTPEFLGLNNVALFGQTTLASSGTNETENGNTTADSESDIVIGIVDTGVWPESESFDDTGMPPVPSWWKGSCVEGEQLTAADCNKKLVGAKWFSQGYEADFNGRNNGTAFNFHRDYRSARDAQGHGSHTASTAAGSVVQNASLFGQASGSARGMAPKARIAAYKVCWGVETTSDCTSPDILAALDAAIEDGVKIVSLSLGGEPSLLPDPVYVGLFSAMAKGIFVSMSAGNDGPGAGTVANNVPWILTVGASTTDRDFPATAVLGNGLNITGKSLSVNEDGSFPKFQELPLILASDAANANSTNSDDASLCQPGSLSSSKVAGNIVVCIRGINDRVEKGQVVKDAGGLGMILVNADWEGEDTITDPHVLPAINVGASYRSALAEYVGTKGAKAGLDIKGTTFGFQAPSIAAFSSRGPNYPVPELLKPDITGPGVNILAAWPNNLPVTSLLEDTRRASFNLLSGTSMSCPHLSGIAALILARRPGWSAAAVRSALMTTAYTTTRGSDTPITDASDGVPASPFDYGNGHVDALAALNPGLVYDIKTDDYIDFLCYYNSSAEYIQGITGTNSTCSDNKEYSPYDLNYPSFAAGYDTAKNESEPKTIHFKRTVTNVGDPGTYRFNVSLSSPDLVNVLVEPKELTFNASNEQKGFTVTATLKPSAAGTTVTGRLVWSNGLHKVGSSLGFVWGNLADLGSD